MGERIGRSIRGHSAYVDGMGRAFRGHSNRWNGGVATLIPLASAQTFGYVTEITDEELDQLDQFESVPRNYRREQIQVMMRKGNQFIPVMATVYLSNSTQKTRPSQACLHAITRTLNEFWQQEGRVITPADITIR